MLDWLDSLNFLLNYSGEKMFTFYSFSSSDSYLSTLIVFSLLVCIIEIFYIIFVYWLAYGSFIIFSEIYVNFLEHLDLYWHVMLKPHIY